MNIMGAVVVWCATCFAVASRETLNGALVGLTITYAMEVRSSTITAFRFESIY